MEQISVRAVFLSQLMFMFMLDFPQTDVCCIGVAGKQCMRQVRDAHREAKELVAAESASAWNEQPFVAGTSGTAAHLQQERSSPEESSATEDAQVNGSSDLDSSVSVHVSGSSNTHPGDSSQGAIFEQSSNAAREGANVASATGIGVRGGAEQPQEEGISNRIVEDFEGDELSPVETEVAAAAEEVGVPESRDLPSMQRVINAATRALDESFPILPRLCVAGDEASRGYAWCSHQSFAARKCPCGTRCGELGECGLPLQKPGGHCQ